MNKSEKRTAYNTAHILQPPESRIPTHITPSLRNLLNPVVESVVGDSDKEIKKEIEPEPSEISTKPLPIDAGTMEPLHLPPNKIPPPPKTPEVQISVRKSKSQAVQAKASENSVDSKSEGRQMKVVDKGKKRRGTVSEDVANPRPGKQLKTEEYALTHAPDLLKATSYGRPISKSTLWKRIQNIRLAEGNLANKVERDATFKKSIEAIDPHALS